MCFSFPQDIFPKYPGEQRHHVGAILPFDKKDLTSTGRLPTSSNSFGCNYSSGSLCKACAGSSATEIFLLRKLRRRQRGTGQVCVNMFCCCQDAGGVQCLESISVFFAHVFADLSAALTCGKAFSATCTCEGCSSQELWGIEGTQILWEYEGVKTATCCKENHDMLESLQKFRL